MMRRMLGLLALTLLSGCAALEDRPPPSRVQGEVRAWPEGSLVPSAVIKVKGQEVKADSRGSYVLENLPEQVAVEAMAPKLEARKRELTLLPGETRQVDLWLAPSSASIAPWILFERGGKIWQADALGTHQRCLTTELPGTQSSPSWVEPGKQYAYIHRQPGRTHAWIRATESTGPLEPVSRYLAPLPDSASEMRWSQAGQRLAFTVAVRSPHLGMGTEIRELDGFSGGMRDLVGGSGNSSNPVWSPDARQLAWSRRVATGTWQIWLSGARGESSRPLLSHGNCLEPTWSPSGQQIAYASNLEGSWDIYFLSVELAGATRPVGVRLTRSPQGGWCRRPLWGPNGEILFESNFHPSTGKLQSGVDLYAVQVATGRIRQVLTDGRSADW